MQKLTEICVDSVRSAIAAQNGGADRVELCCALNDGGLTPSIGLLREVLRHISIPVFVLIRPRAGGFTYTEDEFDVMRHDIVAARQAGCHGLVLGALTPELRVDLANTRALIDLAGALPVTFHRAFDLIADQQSALEDVFATGASRLLTSGGRISATQGLAQLRKLHELAAGRLHLLAGGGLRATNVRSIVEQTGICEVHSSLLSSPAVAPAATDVEAMYAQGAHFDPISAQSVREFCLEFHRAALVESF